MNSRDIADKSRKYITALQKELSDAQMSAQRQIAALERDKDAEIAAIEAERDSLVSVLQEQDVHINEMQEVEERTALLLESYKELEAKHADLVQAHESTSERLKALSEEHTTLKRQLKQAETELTTLRAEHEEMRADRDQSRRAEVAARQARAVLENTLEEVQHEMHSKLGTALEDGQRAAELERTLAAVVKENKTLLDETQTMRDMLQEEKTARTDAEAALVAAGQEHSRALEADETAINELKAGISRLESRLSGESRANPQADELKMVSSVIADQLAEFRSAMHQSDVLNELKEKRRKKSKKTKAASDRVALEATIASLSDELAAAKHAAESHKQAASREKREAADLRGRLTALKAEKGELIKKLAALDGTSAKDEVLSLQRELKVAKTDSDRKKVTLDTLRSRIGDLQEQVKSLTAERDTLETRVEELTKTKKRLHNQVKEAESGLKSTNGRVKGLVKQLDEATSQAQQAERRLAETSRLYEGSMAELKSERARCSEFRDVLEDANERLACFEHDVMRKDAQIRALSSQLEEQTISVIPESLITITEEERDLLSGLDFGMDDLESIGVVVR
ncbi:Chromosome partition protein Smc [Carpediemonas membranifera]|uniref:Chromosome partition protein Smc n=1 Tax=Carpediemonas membranifera TaxID=201153 RepID=A0A8J6BAD1_9EUKA|nr:Chromosome partition protein Smc [Carpediemonas membranifera]|eukprot:KAG9393267.1 Chromosome partition protein Smc [Carpediemonas membranifera]